MQDFSFKYNILYFATSLIFTSVFLLTQPKETAGQSLTAEFADVKLTDGCPRPYYDGEDTIYLFGGCWNDQIEIFSIATGTITRKSIGSLPGSGFFGTVQADNFGNIFYFGGGGNFRNVYKFNPVVNQSSVVATLPLKYRLYFGGYGPSLLAFDLVLFNYTTIASNLPYWVHAAASVQVGNKAYIFNRNNLLNKAIEFDLNTFQMSLVGPGTLPILTQVPSSVRDETHAYLIGGYEPSAGPTNGIYQFDLTTFENTFLPVNNFPVEGSSYYYYSTVSVYVEKQNRIYFFGGISYNQTIDSYKILDDIFFIDLSPLNPEPTTPTTPTTTPTTTTTPTLTTTPTTTPTSTSTQPECDDFLSSSPFRYNVECPVGNPNDPTVYFPYPYDCRKFIICSNGEAVVECCPPDTVWDQELTTCNHESVVPCVIVTTTEPTFIE